MIIYFLLVLVGSLVAGKLILGELRKERRDYIPVSSIQKVLVEPSKNKSSEVDHLTVLSQHTDQELLERVQKVENLLAEKNAELVRLSNVLEAERRHKNEFEKIKSLLQWQIFETRQANKQIKLELESLNAQGQQFKQETYQLKSELNYKEQILTQSEMKISELNNRLRSFLSINSSMNNNTPPNNADHAADTFDHLDWRTKLTE